MLDLYNDTNFFSANKNLCSSSFNLEIYEDPRINILRKISYGFVMPVICFFGIIGNILNLIVLTRRSYNVQGTAYVYMRGKYVHKKYLILIHFFFLKEKKLNRF